MDKIIVSNSTHREEVSSFGDRDARYIGAAVEALNKPGDIVVIEAQHRSLRDHYVKQILSVLFAASAGVVVNRCKKERDWMISAINQALIKNKEEGKDLSQSKLSEVWIVDLSSSEDFELLKLARTLVSQFEDAGVCLLVSCSPSITNQDNFCRWSNRLEIPVWIFELPDASAIDAFLEQEAEMGAINQARRLVNELKSLEDDKLERNKVRDTNDPRELTKSITGNVMPLRADIQQQFYLEEHQLEKGAEFFGDQLGLNEAENGRRSVSDSVSKRNAWAGVKIVIFGFFILAASVASVFVMVDDSLMKEIYEKAVDTHASKIEDYFASFHKKEFLTVLQADSVNVDPNLDGMETEKEVSGVELEAVTEDFVVTIRAPLDAAPGPESLADEDANNEENFLATEHIYLNNLQEKKGTVSEVNVGTRSSEYAEIESNEAVSLQSASTEYFAQLGAFGTKNAALGWQLSRSHSLPKTFVAKKSMGLWVVLSGPFYSRELAKDTFSRIGVDAFVVNGSDLLTK